MNSSKIDGFRDYSIVKYSDSLVLAALDLYFNKHKISHAFMTTQVGRQFAKISTSPYLKYLSVGGEKLVPIDPPKSFDLYNGYGPTECTIFTTSFLRSKIQSDP